MTILNNQMPENLLVLCRLIIGSPNLVRGGEKKNLSIPWQKTRVGGSETDRAACRAGKSLQTPFIYVQHCFSCFGSPISNKTNLLGWIMTVRPIPHVLYFGLVPVSAQIK